MARLKLDDALSPFPLQAALCAVFVAWYLVLVIVWAVLEGSDLGIGSLRAGAFVLAPLGASLVTWWFVRQLLSSHRRLWLGTTLAVVAVPRPAALLFLFLLHCALQTQELSGPPSPDGLTTIVAVRDAGLGWSADFYTDVRVLDRSGQTVAEWKGGGQWPRSGPKHLRDSLRWTTPYLLEFTDRAGPQQLHVPH